MKLDIDQIETFRACPLKYKFKYVDKIKPIQESSKSEFSKLMHRVVYHYFYSLMSGIPVDEQKLREKWQEYWFKGVSVEDVLFGVDQEKTDMGYKGVSMISTFYRQENPNPGFIIGVDMTMDDVPIGDHLITTNLELVREVKEQGRRKLVEIVDFRTGYFTPDDWTAMNDLRLTMMSYAFRKVFEAKEQRMTYYFLRTGKKISTYRGPQQYKRLLNTIDSVATNIENKCFYPNEGAACRTCEFKNVCKVWPA